MSAERMIENALQEQPILLLPVFMLVYFVTQFLIRAFNALFTNTFTTRFPQ
jgi:hypothetical protein